MFLRSMVIAVSLAAVSFTSAHAGWFSKDKPRAEESHQHHSGASKPSKAVNPSTRAYRNAMQRMHKAMRTPLAGNVDADFVRQMIPHHRGALAMAEIQQKYGRDEELKKFNDWVIMAQTQEIAMMENWLRRRDNGAAPQAAKDYYGEAMKAMHHAMMIDYSGDADVDYVRGMIAHHQGAVDMASIWLSGGSDPELKLLANAIYDSQTYEIAWMRDWLSDRSR